MFTIPNWKPVAVRTGFGLFLGLTGALAHHPWVALWSALVLSFGFSLESVLGGENKNAALVDLGLVLAGVVVGILIPHL